MAIETERRFLVEPAKLAQFFLGGNPSRVSRITQGYLSVSPCVRIRISTSETADFGAVLAVKGPRVNGSNDEYESALDVRAALEIYEKVCPFKVTKFRYRFLPNYERKSTLDKWEVDVFTGDNDGLVIAEIEVGKITDAIELPSFVDLANDITTDHRYFNVNLAQNPYKNWTRN